MLEIVASIPFTLNLIIKKINNRAKTANNTIIVFLKNSTVIEDYIYLFPYNEYVIGITPFFISDAID